MCICFYVSFKMVFKINKQNIDIFKCHLCCELFVLIPFEQQADLFFISNLI